MTAILPSHLMLTNVLKLISRVIENYKFTSILEHVKNWFRFSHSCSFDPFAFCGGSHNTLLRAASSSAFDGRNGVSSEIVLIEMQIFMNEIEILA